MIKFALSMIAASIIGLVFLWLSVRGIALDRITDAFAQADKASLAGWCAAFVGVYLISHVARVVRWIDLVRPLDARVSAHQIHRVNLVGSAAILLLPLRVGELVRPYLLVKKSSLKMSAGLGTAVVERVIDGLVMTGLLFVSLATYSGARATGFATWLGIISACVFVGALVGCLGALRWRAQTLRLVERLLSPLSRKLADRIGHTLEAFIDGFQGLVRAHHLGRFMAYTALYWLTNVLSMWMLARHGFGLQVGPWQMSAVLSILVIGITIPAGPGLAGNFQYFLMKGLGLFIAIEALEGRVLAFAATLHLLQLLVIVAPALVVMVIDPQTRHLIDLSQSAERAVMEEGDDEPAESADVSGR